MIFELDPEAQKHLKHWKRADPSKVKRISAIMKAIEVDPYGGIAKPEPLRHELAGWWSRRIDEEHRFVYRVDGDRCYVASLRYHYGK